MANHTSNKSGNSFKAPGGIDRAYKMLNEMSFFKNSVFITLKSKEVIYTRKDIYIGLYNMKDDNLTKSIDCISQYNTNNTWVISFTDKFKASTLSGCQVKIINEEANIEFMEPNSINNGPIYSVYRVQWLPHHFPKDDLKKYFKKFNDKIEILNIYEETCRYENVKMDHIKNGNLRVKIKFPVAEIEKINIATGMVYINGFKVILTKIGDPPKCLFCNKNGHFKKDCDKIKLKCENCNKRGHIKDSCNLANRLSEIPDISNQLNDDNENESAQAINPNTDHADLNSRNEPITINTTLATNVIILERNLSTINSDDNGEPLNEDIVNNVVLTSNNNNENSNSLNSLNDKKKNNTRTIKNNNRKSELESEEQPEVTIDSILRKCKAVNDSENKKDKLKKKRALTASPLGSKNANKKSNCKNDLNDQDSNSNNREINSNDEDMVEENSDFSFSESNEEN
jgi:hypothetical protein